MIKMKGFCKSLKEYTTIAYFDNIKNIKFQVHIFVVPKSNRVANIYKGKKKYLIKLKFQNSADNAVLRGLQFRNPVYQEKFRQKNVLKKVLKKYFPRELKITEKS